MNQFSVLDNFNSFPMFEDVTYLLLEDEEYYEYPPNGAIVYSSFENAVVAELRANKRGLMYEEYGILKKRIVGLWYQDFSGNYTCITPFKVSYMFASNSFRNFSRLKLEGNRVYLLKESPLLQNQFVFNKDIHLTLEMLIAKCIDEFKDSNGYCKPEDLYKKMIGKRFIFPNGRICEVTNKMENIIRFFIQKSDIIISTNDGLKIDDTEFKESCKIEGKEGREKLFAILKHVDKHCGGIYRTDIYNLAHNNGIFKNTSDEDRFIDLFLGEKNFFQYDNIIGIKPIIKPGRYLDPYDFSNIEPSSVEKIANIFREKKFNGLIENFMRNQSIALPREYIFDIITHNPKFCIDFKEKTVFLIPPEIEACNYGFLYMNMFYSTLISCIIRSSSKEIIKKKISKITIPESPFEAKMFGLFDPDDDFYKFIMNFCNPEENILDIEDISDSSDDFEVLPKKKVSHYSKYVEKNGKIDLINYQTKSDIEELVLKCAKVNFGCKTHKKVTIEKILKFVEGEAYNGDVIKDRKVWKERFTQALKHSYYAVHEQLSYTFADDIPIVSDFVYNNSLEMYKEIARKQPRGLDGEYKDVELMEKAYGMLFKKKGDEIIMASSTYPKKNCFNALNSMESGYYKDGMVSFTHKKNEVPEKQKRHRHDLSVIDQIESDDEDDGIMRMLNYRRNKCLSGKAKKSKKIDTSTEKKNDSEEKNYDNDVEILVSCSSSSDDIPIYLSDDGAVFEYSEEDPAPWPKPSFIGNDNKCCNIFVKEPLKKESINIHTLDSVPVMKNEPLQPLEEAVKKLKKGTDFSVDLALRTLYPRYQKLYNITEFISRLWRALGAIDN